MNTNPYPDDPFDEPFEEFNKISVEQFRILFGDPLMFFEKCEPHRFTFVTREGDFHNHTVTMCGYTAFRLMEEQLDDFDFIHMVWGEELVCTSILCNPIDDEGAF